MKEVNKKKRETLVRAQPKLENSIEQGMYKTRFQPWITLCKDTGKIS